MRGSISILAICITFAALAGCSSNGASTISNPGAVRTASAATINHPSARNFAFPKYSMVAPMGQGWVASSR